MKAAYIEEVGPPEVIQYGEIPTPTPGPGQVLVKVGAVAVNPIDTYIRNGANYWELPKPFVVGSDMAGEVAEVGKGVSRFRAGDRVWCTNQGFMGRQGVFAGFCCVDEHWLYPSPDGVSDNELAACALVGVTAHLGLARESQIKAGDTIFVNGGTGGVGSMVVQMAKAAGARVFATAGTDEKVAACKSLGAAAAANYHDEQLAELASEFAPSGFNIYWETVREPDFDAIVGYMAERGRVILMAGRDARPPFPVGPFYVKECSLHGFVMFKATPEEMAACAEDINRWLAQGEIKANITRVFPLAETAAAHRLQEENTVARSGTIAGKIVLNPG